MNFVNQLTISGRIKGIETKMFASGKSITLIRLIYANRGKEYELEVKSFRTPQALYDFGVDVGDTVYVYGKLDISDFANKYGGISRKWGVVAWEIVNMKENEATSTANTVRPTKFADYEQKPYAQYEDKGGHVDKTYVTDQRKDTPHPVLETKDGIPF